MLSSIPRYSPWHKRRPMNWLQSNPNVQPFALNVADNFNFVGSPWLGMYAIPTQYTMTLPDNFQTLPTPLFNATAITFKQTLPDEYRAPAMPLQNAQTTQTTMTLPANYLEKA